VHPRFRHACALPLQRRRLFPGLPFPTLCCGKAGVPHGFGPDSSLVTEFLAFTLASASKYSHLAGLAQNSACLGIGRIGQLVSCLLDHASTLVTSAL
jgi:hypothetical protein